MKDKNNSTMKKIPINQLEDHPDNPRITFREDVIQGIANQIKEKGFDRAHALVVRPLDNGNYQILQGHQRKRSAQKAGLGKVPCWVKDCDDDEAYMELVLGNVQGEMSPLEIGIHALGTVEEGKIGQGRGNIGGLGQYADQIGKDRSHVSDYKNGAKVLDKVDKKIWRQCHILDKAKHLAEIHKLPKKLWEILVEWLIDNNKSRNQIQELRRTIQKYKIPEEWEDIYDLEDVVVSYLEDKTPKPKKLNKTIELASNIEGMIEKQNEEIESEEFDYSKEQFKDWLSKGIGTYAWDKSELKEYRQQIIRTAKEAKKPNPADVQRGEWYKLGNHILYCGDTSKKDFYSNLPNIQFAFADPPYNAGKEDWDENFEWQHDWLEKKADLVTVTPGIASIEDFFTEGTTMNYRWSLSCWLNNNTKRGPLGFANWIYIALFSQKNQLLDSKEQDHIEVSIKTSETDETEHPTRKPSSLLNKLIDIFTNKGDFIIDPFLGSGTTLFQSEEKSRKCIGGEKNIDYCNEIINRWQEKTGLEVKQIEKGDIK